MTQHVHDEQAEIDALRAEVERLRAAAAQPPQPPQPPSAPPERSGRWRTVLVTFLVVLIAILTPLGVVARWAHNEVSDTDRYVQSVAPLASDPAIQAAVTDRITTEITSRLQVQAVTQDAVTALQQRGLSPTAANTLSALSGPLANAIDGFIHDKVAQLVASDQFKTAWEQANREAHTQMVAVLTGKGSDVVDVKNGAVSIQLATLIDAVKQRLVDQGFQLAEKLPEVNAQFTIFQSSDITKAQQGFRLLNALNTLLPVLLLVLLGVAVAVARSRRRALIAAMLAVAGSMLLLGVVLNAFRMVYLNAIPATMSSDAAAAVYDTLVWFIRLNLRAILVLTLTVAFIAWVAGPSTSAVGVRTTTGRAVGWLRHGSQQAGLNTGRFGAFLDTYRTAIRAVVLGLAVLAYVMLDHPTGSSTLVIVAVAAVVLLVVELLARPAAPPTALATPATTPATTQATTPATTPVVPPAPTTTDGDAPTPPSERT